ncbi:MAG: hypothetical protein AVDCRST_MAG86-3463 [uncultured Truepera sp.]|uniref:Sialate O-acetylesterase domain-containing protein n=1 Tax=uncultured Truepera sp. TaxID=543023 RepID=A0A6J4VR30_9DEIN|nr:MAG: hypothetical protein AVDCRST_MAG86-3463 [uncultured Truepera sp.]
MKLTTILEFNKRIVFAVAALLILGGLGGVLLQPSFLRPLAELAVTARRTEVPIRSVRSGRVMVALTFGQSNAANSGETRYRSRGRVYNFYQGKLYAARDPLLGATGRGGSVWTRLGDRLVAQGRYDAVVFVPLGVGATGIARWAPGGDLHAKVVSAIREVKGSGLNVTHLMWHQGESDVGRTGTLTYETMFLDMLVSIRDEGVNAPIYVSVATRCHNQGADRTIRRAQQGLVDPSLGIYAGPDTDKLGRRYRYDRCHFSTEGLEKFAELWLKALAPGGDK